MTVSELPAVTPAPARQGPPILRIQHLRVGFEVNGRRVQAVADASLEVPAGGGVGLVGESGSGKSTLARAVLGLLPTAARELRADRFEVDGRRVDLNDRRAVARLRGGTVAMVFQDPLSYLNPLMQVRRQIAEAIELHDPDVGQARRIAELLDLVRLPQTAARAYPHELSGGMRQRVLLAIALACRPKLLIADEPTTALDVTTQAEILALLREIRRELNMALLLISHDLGTVATLCDWVYVMYAGKTVEAGPRRSIFSAPQHPYTIGLMRAARALRDETGRFATLHGDVPKTVAAVAGCPFQPRCPAAFEPCGRMPPAFVVDGRAHEARCWLRDPERQDG